MLILKLNYCTRKINPYAGKRLLTNVKCEFLSAESGARRSASTSPSRQALLGVGLSPASRDRSTRSEHVSPLHTPHLTSSEASPPMRTRGGSLLLERELDRRLVRQKLIVARQGPPAGYTHLSELNSQVLLQTTNLIYRISGQLL